jgi:hypothetical protein
MSRRTWRSTRAAELCLGVCLLSGCGSGGVDAVALAPGGLETDLVAHWSFDEGSGDSVHDSSSNHRDGTLHGSTWSWLSQGRFGQALHLEQGDDVTVDNFPNASSGWTVSVWAQIADTDIGADGRTVLSTEDVFKGGWEINLMAPASYHFGFWVGPGPDWDHFECVNCIHPNHWQHLVAVVDASASTLAFYLDGVLQIRQSILRPISPGVSTLYMGRWATTSPARLLAGSLDDIAIWARPLVGSEVAALTRAPAP